MAKRKKRRRKGIGGSWAEDLRKAKVVIAAQEKAQKAMVRMVKDDPAIPKLRRKAKRSGDVACGWAKRTYARGPRRVRVQLCVLPSGAIHASTLFSRLPGGEK